MSGDNGKQEGKIGSEALQGGIKYQVDPGANMKWKIEHAGCDIGYTHITNESGKPITLFMCQRHPFSTVLACPGHHQRIPE